MSGNDLDAFFAPRGVAIVGATRTPGFGYALPLHLTKHGWGERTSLVNPSGGTLHGYQVYKSVAEVPDPLDLAVMIVPAAAAPSVMDEIGKRGVRSVIVESAGFAETGDEGRALQEQTLAAARRHKIRVIGPNCVGVVNNMNRFSTVEIIDEATAPGPVAIIAQSGVFGNVLLDNLHQRGILVSKAVTMGNRMDVDECDVLEYLHHDPDTKVIMMYLEGAADGRRLIETVSRVSRDKPVLVLKSGRTGPGKAATASHTGSMSGQDELYDAAFSQAGAVRAGDMEDLLGFTRAFSTQPLPRGNRIGIVTTSGSLGALATDAAIAGGLELARLSDATVEKVGRGSPGWMNVRNPLDVGPSGQFSRAVPLLIADPSVDMVLIITIIPFAVVRQFKPLGLTPRQWFGDLAAVRAAARDKPFVVCAMGNTEFVEDIKDMAGTDTPVYNSPEPAARALAALWRHEKWRRSCRED